MMRMFMTCLALFLAHAALGQEQDSAADKWARVVAQRLEEAKKDTDADGLTRARALPPQEYYESRPEPAKPVGPVPMTRKRSSFDASSPGLVRRSPSQEKKSSSEELAELFVSKLAGEKAGLTTIGTTIGHTLYPTIVRENNSCPLTPTRVRNTEELMVTLGGTSDSMNMTLTQEIVSLKSARETLNKTNGEVTIALNLAKVADDALGSCLSYLAPAHNSSMNCWTELQNLAHDNKTKCDLANKYSKPEYHVPDPPLRSPWNCTYDNDYNLTNCWQNHVVTLFNREQMLTNLRHQYSLWQLAKNQCHNATDKFHNKTQVCVNNTHNGTPAERTCQDALNNVTLASCKLKPLLKKQCDEHTRLVSKGEATMQTAKGVESNATKIVVCMLDAFNTTGNFSRSALNACKGMYNATVAVSSENVSNHTCQLPGYLKLPHLSAVKKAKIAMQRALRTFGGNSLFDSSDFGPLVFGVGDGIRGLTEIGMLVRYHGASLFDDYLPKNSQAASLLEASSEASNGWNYDIDFNGLHKAPSSLTNVDTSPPEKAEKPEKADAVVDITADTAKQSPSVSPAINVDSAKEIIREIIEFSIPVSDMIQKVKGPGNWVYADKDGDIWVDTLGVCPSTL